MFISILVINDAQFSIENDSRGIINYLLLYMESSNIINIKTENRIETKIWIIDNS